MTCLLPIPSSLVALVARHRACQNAFPCKQRNHTRVLATKQEIKARPCSAAISASVSRSSNPHPPNPAALPTSLSCACPLPSRTGVEPIMNLVPLWRTVRLLTGDLRLVPSAPSALRSPTRGPQSAPKHLGSIPRQNLVCLHP